ncbi:uncharacterized protein BDR25DRAFT_302436 [Lindgomyces ingoldianus]|uniref:Uncharacterized protein n=1 Tax=Lindgomyces ingoldianus TaxID=673940 RepID=A0ACB6R1W5_9PLEO|nr:uncharacterized protein BDR25DRAFT_302436 [Lindgomyces ingoldianus]KAF2472780.1 hypothetical protein BDR25DRAFT_302436 [Lindgomyces ingoldianus]
MTPSISSPSIPSESDDEVDYADTDLPLGNVWAYPCKLPSCPDYGKSWLLRSNFLFHLKEEDAHRTAAMTPAARRIIEKEWRYTTDPDLPRRAAPEFCSREDPDEHVQEYGFRYDTGRVVRGYGTMKQMEMHKELRRQETQQRKTA